MEVAKVLLAYLVISAAGMAVGYVSWGIPGAAIGLALALPVALIVGYLFLVASVFVAIELGIINDV